MGELQGQWVPSSEEEFALIKGLYGVTGEAQQRGVDIEDIVTALHFVGLSIATMDEDEVPEPPKRADKKREDCPECGTEIDEVRPFMGGDVEVSPCGCFVTVHQVPGWFEDV